MAPFRPADVTVAHLERSPLAPTLLWVPRDDRAAHPDLLPLEDASEEDPDEDADDDDDDDSDHSSSSDSTDAVLIYRLGHTLVSYSTYVIMAKSATYE